MVLVPMVAVKVFDHTNEVMPTGLAAAGAFLFIQW